MALTKAIVRDSRAARRFRLIAPVLVIVGLALLAMVPGILVHLSSGAEGSDARSILHRLVLDQTD